MDDLKGIKSWQTWRVVTASDTLLTDYKPEDVWTAADGVYASGIQAKILPVDHHSAVALRAFGKETIADTATVRISGWMTPPEVGPGMILWHGQVKLSTKSFAGIPFADGKWGSSATWFFNRVWNAAGNTWGAAEPYVVHATVGSNFPDSLLILPTFGFTQLLLEIDDLGGGGTEMTELGIVARKVAKGGVV